MTASILNTIKKMLGLSEDYTVYDVDVITLINSALMTLQQYGVGPKQGFIVTSSEQTWGEFFAESNGKQLEAVKMYVYLKVKMVFDPPQTSFVMDAFKETCQETEWRLKEQMESYPGDLPRVEPTPVYEGSTATEEEPTTIGGSEAVDTEDAIIGESDLSPSGGDS